MRRLLTIALCLALLLSLIGCSKTEAPAPTAEAPSEAAALASEGAAAPLEEIDYAGQLQLDMSSSTAKAEVTVKQFIDGDTTHFFVPTSVMEHGVLKGRYLAINTPESTGKIEEFGKAASRFTKEKLSGAVSIIIESETETWDPDSTGSRYLCWVWYKPAGSDTYRNLNVEILQNGLAIASNAAGNRYGEICMAAINQAKGLKLNIYSGQKDPDFYYGGAVELTLKELRTNIEAYNGMKVAFNGVVTMNNNNTVYVEDYDPETEMYYGMAVYYGFGLNGQGLDILSLGNEVRIVGSLQYYEAGGTYQVSDLSYRLMKPDDPNNIQMLSQGHAPAFPEVDPEVFAGGVVEVLVEEQPVSFPYAQLAMNSSISMKGLHVYDVYTTANEDSASKGAMTLYCSYGSTMISVRTIVLYDENGELVTKDRYLGKTIDVSGIVDFFSGTYQIKVFNTNDIIVN